MSPTVSILCTVVQRCVRRILLISLSLKSSTASKLPICLFNLIWIPLFLIIFHSSDTWTICPAVLFHIEHWSDQLWILACYWTCLFFLSFVEIASFLNQGLLFGKISVFVKRLQGSRHCSKHFTNIKLLNSHNNPMKGYIYDPHFIGEETAERVTCLSRRSSSVTRLHWNPGSCWLQPRSLLCSFLPSMPSLCLSLSFIKSCLYSLELCVRCYKDGCIELNSGRILLCRQQKNYDMLQCWWCKMWWWQMLGRYSCSTRGPNSPSVNKVSCVQTPR